MNTNVDYPVIGVSSEMGRSCGGRTDACTTYATTCIDCTATGATESDPDACTYDENKCACPDGCVINGQTVGGSQDDIEDEAGCDAIQGTWEAEGDPKTVCAPRDAVMGALYLGDGTEAAELVCATSGGQGTGAGQCEGSDALTRIKGIAALCTDGAYDCPTTDQIAALGCEWSSDTSTCVPNAALTTLLTDTWTASKAVGMLSAMVPGVSDVDAAKASGAGTSAPSVIAAAVALMGGLFAL